jgi:hypothetical protein
MVPPLILRVREAPHHNKHVQQATIDLNKQNMQLNIHVLLAPSQQQQIDKLLLAQMGVPNALQVNGVM